VLERIRREGALKVSNFESDVTPAARGGTGVAKLPWNFLLCFGELMVADRGQFQRVYDLTERVLPEWWTRRTTVEERDRFWVERGAKALGICLHAMPETIPG